MGAWSHGSFDNDSALDWLGELTDGEPSLLGDTFEGVLASPEGAYLDADECSAVLAAAELVAAAWGHGTDRLSKSARDWLEAHRSFARQLDTARVLQAVQRVFESSELRELWDENGPDNEWHTDVRELLRRLGG